MKPIYLDNNASTPVIPCVYEAMKPFLFDQPGNPASSHQFGRHTRKALEDAREKIASLLDAQPDEVIFTSGATEANNLAIFGLIGTNPGAIVSSMIEHPSVVEPIQQLAGAGFRFAQLPVSCAGSFDAEISTFPYPDDVRLVCWMMANHETGAIQPVQQLAYPLQFSGAAFHCDAAAAAGKLSMSFRTLSIAGVTSVTISAHKFHGPKGIGALLLRRDAKLRPRLFGGHQQQGKRPGTEPVALAVGMASALEWSVQNLDGHRAVVIDLRRRLLSYLREHASPVILNGPEDAGLPHTLNISFPGCKADALLMSLDLAGVACSTGSACSSGSLLPSPVLTAMGKSGEVLHSAMRFSMSPLMCAAEMDEASRRITQCVNKLRHTSCEGD